MERTFTYWCMDCGATRHTLKLDDSNEEDQKKIDAINHRVDRWGEDEEFGSRLCKECREDVATDRY